MAITRLGLTGPMAAYPGFTAKTEEISVVTAVSLTGSYVLEYALPGSYVPSVPLTGKVGS